MTFMDERLAAMFNEMFEPLKNIEGGQQALDNLAVAIRDVLAVSETAKLDWSRQVTKMMPSIVKMVFV